MMPRFAKLLWVALLVASAFGLYMVKYRVQGIQAEIAAINRQMEDERESLHVVAAEWSYLNQPERLQQLSENYLKLQPVKVAQMVEVAGIPEPHQEVASAGAGIKPVSMQQPLEAE